MPHLIILPAYGVLLAALAIAFVWIRATQPGSTAPSRLLHAGLGSLAGFVAGNVLLLAIVFVDARWFPNTDGNLLGERMALLLFVGPYVSSTLGIVSGAWIALRMRRRRLDRNGAQQPTPR